MFGASFYRANVIVKMSFILIKRFLGYQIQMQRVMALLGLIVSFLVIGAAVSNAVSTVVDFRAVNGLVDVETTDLVMQVEEQNSPCCQSGISACAHSHCGADVFASRLSVSVGLRAGAPIYLYPSFGILSGDNPRPILTPPRA